MSDGRETYGCPYCSERYLREEHRILHVGQVHPDVMGEAERVAFESAQVAEEEWFRKLQKHVRAGLAVIPVFLLYVMTVVLLYQAQGNPAFAIMLFPGFVAFSALVYGVTLSYQVVREERMQKDAGERPGFQRPP